MSMIRYYSAAGAVYVTTCHHNSRNIIIVLPSQNTPNFRKGGTAGILLEVNWVLVGDGADRCSLVPTMYV